MIQERRREDGHDKTASIHPPFAHTHDIEWIPRATPTRVDHIPIATMMKWSLDQLAGLSAITNRFGGVDDPDLSLLLDRIKGLEDAYE